MSGWAMISPVLPPMALPLVLVMVLILTASMRNIDIMVPTFLHEIDRLATRIVPGAMRAPVLGMARRHTEIDRLRSYHRGCLLNHNGLLVDNRWRR